MKNDISNITDQLGDKMNSSGKLRKSRAARISKDRTNPNSVLKK